MAEIIDVRAKVYCSLGPVISGSFSDDYLQDSGLIKTRGEVTLNGIFRPKAGEVVEFAYERDGVLSRLPRKLRVLSVFADPYRNTTTIALGCKLSYLENRRPPLENPTSEDENGETPPNVINIAKLPISASFVFSQCLSALGLSASSNPLTNKFSVSEFDLSSGYLTVISDLLKSEGYFGFVDESETLVVRSLGNDSGRGPVVGIDNLIDISPIDVGELPAEAVAVNFSYLKLKPIKEDGGDDEGASPGGNPFSITTGSPVEVVVSATYEATGQEVTRTGKYIPVSKSSEKYNQITIRNADTGKVSKKDVLLERTETSNGHWLEAVGGYVSGQLQVKGRSTEIWGTFERTVRTTYEYNREGDVIRQVTTEEVPGGVIEGAAPVAWADVLKAGISLPRLNSLPIVTSRAEVYISYSKSADVTTTKTMTYKSFVSTSGGQNAMARAMDSALQDESPLRRIRLGAAMSSIMLQATNLTFDNSTVNVSIGRGAQDSVDRAPAAGNDRGPLEQTNQAGLEFISGSTESQLVAEFNMPYSGDDYLTASSTSESYVIIRSDAAVKARNYGNIQNRLLLGNRNGVSIQITADLMPPRPFAPIYIEAEGFVGQYRTNGTTYTFDSSGIIASTDAVFWGGVGAS